MVNIQTNPKKNIWVISDTHFNHTNIIKYCDRPFDDAKHMDDYLVTFWNETVKDGDKVYHLGDVYFGGNNEDPQYIDSLLSKLKGQKRLILGNHDNGKDQKLHRAFKKIEVWRMFPEFGLLLTHVPVHESSLWRGEERAEGTKKLLNIHGHIHQNKSPSDDHRCVCVEQIDYKPINIEELRKW